MAGKPKGYLVFDCDGTLISSMTHALEVTALSLTKFFGREWTLAETSEKFTSDLPQFYKNIGVNDLADRQRLAQMFSELFKANSKIHEHKPFAGIPEMIDHLIDLGFDLYLWTARDRDSTEEVLKHCNMWDKFKIAVCGDDGDRKPDTKEIDKYIGHLPKDKVVIIGDSQADIIGAKAFDCHFIGVLWCEHSKENVLKDMGADYLVRTPSQCFDVITRDIFKIQIEN